MRLTRSTKQTEFFVGIIGEQDLRALNTASSCLNACASVQIADTTERTGTPQQEIFMQTRAAIQ